ncbi:MAG: ferrochelatase [Planctomycetota bacterium]
MTDGVLIAGFGGPTPGCCERLSVCDRKPGCEATCFVSGILGDDPAQAARVAAVAAHYQDVGGGFSPYNALAATQADALRSELRRRGRDVVVALGFRHWSPWIADACTTLSGCQRTVGLMLAVHATGRTADAYRAACTIPNITWTASLHDHPGMATAVAERLRAATIGWSADRLQRATLVFTAHAIPQPAERASGYREQVAVSATLAAQAFGKPEHRIAYQSAPPPGRVPWSTPQIGDMLNELAASGVKDVLLQPIGFLIDHMEVIYDLDVESQQQAKRLGLCLTRAATVGDHPAFIAAMAERIEQAHLGK